MSRLLLLCLPFWVLTSCSYSELAIGSPYLTGRVDVDRTVGIRANGIDRVHVLVRVFDSSQARLEGREVRIVASNGATVDNPEALTNDNGMAEGFVTADSPGEVEISAVVRTDVGDVPLPHRHTVTFVESTTTVPIFAAAKTITVGVHPYDLATAELDGDGISDLLTVNWTAGTLDVLLGDSNGLTRHPESIWVDEFPRDVAIARVGGRTRVFVAHPTLDALETIDLDELDVEDTGHYETRATPRALVVADMDGSGDDDVVVACANGFSVTVFLADGDGGLEELEHVGAGLTPSALAVGDFDDDGDNDVAVADPAGSAINLLINDGDGGLSEGPILTIALPTALTAYDANGDGKDDLAVVTGSLATAQLYIQNADGLAESSLVVAQGSLEAVNHADLDHDGRPELLVADTAGARLLVLQFDASNEELSVLTTLATGAGPIAIATGDWNFDGLKDIATANFDGASVSVFYGE